MAIHFGSKILTLIGNLFFPTTCLGCGAGGSTVCRKCYLQAYQKLSWHWQEGRHQAAYFFHYDTDCWTIKALHLLKYSGYSNMVIELGNLLRPVLPMMPICSIPMHYKKQKSRGFNQVDLLLKTAGCRSIHNLLTKKRQTKAQMELSAESRAKNLNQAYAVILGTLPPRQLVIFDDVATTYATLEEAARVLRAAGVEEIFFLSMFKKT